MARAVRIGTGSGGERERVQAAVDIAERGDITYLCFDGLAERTLMQANQAKLQDPGKGYNPMLERRMKAVLPIARRKGIKITCNFGAANPPAAFRLTKEVAKGLGHKGTKVAMVTGDDVKELVHELPLTDFNTGQPLKLEGKDVVSANAYLGAEPIVEALKKGADVVITGRCADPSLWLAPLMHEYNWAPDDWEDLGFGTMIAHLLECSGNATGTDLAHPPYIPVPGLHDVGMPWAEVYPDGTALIGKTPGSGGVVSPVSMKLQLAWEVHDPANYTTPDVVADFTQVRVEDAGKDLVKVQGARGKPRTKTLKTLIGVREGTVVEGEVGWAGWNSVEKAQMTITDLVKPRLARWEKDIIDIRYDIIGVNSTHGPVSPPPPGPLYETRLRIAVLTKNAELIEYLNDLFSYELFLGPLGSGGARCYSRPMLVMYPTLIPRELVERNVKVTVEEVN